MRLLVCGTREWSGSWEDIAEHLPECDDITVIHGACSRIDARGVQVSVDMLADFAARGLGHDVDAYPVINVIDGLWPAAGPRRNARMLWHSKPTHGLAFGPIWKQDTKLNTKQFPLYEALIGSEPRWRATGTGDMVRRMLDADLPVRWVPAPGEAAQALTVMPAPPRCLA